MTHEIQMFILAALCVACFVRGVFAYLRFQRRHWMDRVDAEHRAFVMVQEAKREAARRA